MVLWNVDLTLVDVVKVSRAAFAEAFKTVTGRPLVKLPQMAGRSEPEMFFDALALNGVSLRDDDSERLLAPFGAELATALAARRDSLAAEGRLLSGAPESLAAVAKAQGRRPVGAHRVQQAQRRRSSCTPSAWTSTWTWASAGTAPRPTPGARCCR